MSILEDFLAFNKYVFGWLAGCMVGAYVEREYMGICSIYIGLGWVVYELLLH